MIDGNKLYLKRIEAGLTLKELAGIVGSSISSLHRIESGKVKKINPVLEKRLVSALNLEFDYQKRTEASSIGKRISELRKSKEISIDALALAINKNRATIYRYENESSETIPCSVIIPLCKALETTPNYLLGWED